jgi:hypothetical protein
MVQAPGRAYRKSAGDEVLPLGRWFPALFVELPRSQVWSILSALKLWNGKLTPMKKSNVQTDKQPAETVPPAAAEPLVVVEAATVTP